MLIASTRTLELVALLVPIIDALRVRSPHLADQLDRAADNVHLQLGEGSGRRGRDQKCRYRYAAAEAQEVKAALELVRVKRLVAAALLDAAWPVADHVAALTFGLAR